MRYDSGLDATVQEDSNSLPATLAVVKRPVVDVHPDERIGILSLKTSGVAHGVIQRARAVLQTIGDTLPEVSRHFPLQLVVQIFANDIPAKGKGKPGLAEPPLAHVGHQVKSLRSVR